MLVLLNLFFRHALELDAQFDRVVKPRDGSFRDLDLSCDIAQVSVTKCPGLIGRPRHLDVLDKLGDLLARPT